MKLVLISFPIQGIPDGDDETAAWGESLNMEAELVVGELNPFGQGIAYQPVFAELVADMGEIGLRNLQFINQIGRFL